MSVCESSPSSSSSSAGSFHADASSLRPLKLSLKQLAPRSETKAQIKVFCRFRPPTSGGYARFLKRRNQSYSPGDAKAELIAQNFLFSKDCSTVRYINKANDSYDNQPGQNGEIMDFAFDHVFQPTASQKEIYESTVEGLVNDCLDGYNCTAFAYGQTGSGKTHTMLGETDQVGGSLSIGKKSGIIPRAISSLFESLHTMASNGEINESFQVTFSALEIYLEKIRDLLLPESKSSGRFESLQLRQNGDNGVWADGALEFPVSSADELIELVDKAHEKRVTGSTFMNQDSSRSHSVFLISISTTNSSTTERKRSKLVLVDLAGSELNKKTGGNSLVLEEAKTINKSLSALGNVIKALVEKQNHVPYRDSKLTRLLQSSLGGNSKTSFILTCSPSALDVTETVSTLRFGKRAKNVVNAPVLNISQNQSTISESELKEMRILMTSLEGKISELEEENMILLESKVSNEAELEHLQKLLDSLKVENADLNRKIRESETCRSPVQESFKRVRNYTPRSGSTQEMCLMSPMNLNRFDKEKVPCEIDVNTLNPPELDVCSPCSSQEQSIFSSPVAPFRGQSFFAGSPKTDSSTIRSRSGTSRLNKQQAEQLSCVRQRWKIGGSLRSSVNVEDLESKEDQEESSFEHALVDMTKKLVDMRTELARKDEELRHANKLLQSKSKKHYAMSFLKHAGSSVGAKEFMEVVKRKDENIIELEAQMKELRSQLSFLNTRCSVVEVEKQSAQALLQSREGHIRFLQETLEEYGGRATVSRTIC